MYTKHYNLNEKPFNLTPDPSFLYLTNSHREALSSMEYGIHERKGIIAITGEVGTGKTTLIYSLLNNMNKKVNTVYIYHTNISFEQLLKKILGELNIAVVETDKTSLLEKLNDYLIKKLEEDEIIAIIIDEAQNLQDNVLEELRMLTNLETSKSKLLQLVLVGQPELETKLNSEKLRQLKQRIVIKYQLKTLSVDESKNYIKHRLQVAGNTLKLFDKKAIARVCNHANGIPRAINVLCDNALLIGYSKSAKKINLDIIDEVINDMNVFNPNQPINATANVQNDTANITNKPIHINYKTALPFILFLGIIIYAFNTTILPSPNNKPIKNKAIKNSIKKPTPKVSPITIGKGTILTTSMSEKNLRQDETKTIIKEEHLTSSHDFTIPNTNSKVEDHELINTQQVNTFENIDKFQTKVKNIKFIAKAKNGSTIFNIARKHYKKANATLAYMIIKANPEITDINHIKINQKINIPEITVETPLIKSLDNTYIIEVGTFQSLEYAKKYYVEPLVSDKKIIINPILVSSNLTWYQVILEKFETREDGLAKIVLLKENGLLPCFKKTNLSMMNSLIFNYN